MKYFLLALLLTDCHVQGCPPNTAQVTLQCRQDVAKGLKTKDDCYSEIEKSCP